jgi:hypothetical protein
MIDRRPVRESALEKIRYALEDQFDTVDVTFMRGTNRINEWIVKDKGEYIDIKVHAKYGKITHIEK